MKGPAVYLVALALLGSFCDAMQGSNNFRQSYRKPLDHKRQMPPDIQQEKKTFGKPFRWAYPTSIPVEPKVAVDFVPAPPAPPPSIAVECRESDARVEVKMDFFGTGHFINPADLTLGNCGPALEDNNAQVLIYESALHDCQSSLYTTDDSLIYTFMLNYNPQPVGGVPVLRTSQAAVTVECYYQRKHNVSSLPINPEWKPFSEVKVVEEYLRFEMHLMTDDWMYARPSYQYYLGDRINIEVSLHPHFHAPLRIYVDSCIASVSSDPDSNPKYAVIEHNGCYTDSTYSASSKFLRRTEDNKLCFELEAFRFQGIDTGLFYLTCYLKATLATNSIDNFNKACSYINGNWKEASGVDSACGSCSSGPFQQPGGSRVVNTYRGNSNGARKSRDVSETTAGYHWESRIKLGPFRIDHPLAEV